jgi:hypothetical protein
MSFPISILDFESRTKENLLSLFERKKVRYSKVTNEIHYRCGMRNGNNFIVLLYSMDPYERDEFIRYIPVNQLNIDKCIFEFSQTVFKI